MTVQSLTILSATISTIALFLNVFGICILMRSDFQKSSQMTLINNLSIVGVIFSILWIVADISIFIDEISVYFFIVFITARGISTTWLLTMIFLTVDRFFGVNFPLKYRANVNYKHYRKLAVALWITGVITAILLYFLPNFIRICDYMYLALDGAFLLLFIATYSSIYYRLKRGGPNSNQKTGSRDNQKLIKMVTIMLTSFLIFEAIPEIAFSPVVSSSYKRSDAIDILILLFFRLHNLLSPIIYVMLNPKARTTLINICRSANRKSLRLHSGDSGVRNRTQMACPHTIAYRAPENRGRTA